MGYLSMIRSLEVGVVYRNTVLIMPSVAQWWHRMRSSKDAVGVYALDIYEKITS